MLQEGLYQHGGCDRVFHQTFQLDTRRRKPLCAKNAFPIQTDFYFSQQHMVFWKLELLLSLGENAGRYLQS